MKKKRFFVSLSCLVCMIGTLATLVPLSQSRELGRPGIRTEALPDGRCRILLPELAGFEWEEIEPAEVELRTLPADTSFGRRIYRAKDGFQVLVNVVLMGTDRTSIHKPEFCLTSQGWRILEESTITIPISMPRSYRMRATKFLVSKIVKLPDGHAQPVRGIYLFWFVADDRLAASHLERLLWTSWDLIRTRKLPRWAYIGCFATCYPGMEQQTERRLIEFARRLIPFFQLATGPRLAD